MVLPKATRTIPPRSRNHAPPCRRLRGRGSRARQNGSYRSRAATTRLGQNRRWQPLRAAGPAGRSQCTSLDSGTSRAHSLQYSWLRGWHHLFGLRKMFIEGSIFQCRDYSREWGVHPWTSWWEVTSGAAGRGRSWEGMESQGPLEDYFPH